MTGFDNTFSRPDWRDSMSLDEIEHWERIWEREREIAQRAEKDSVKYTYYRWSGVRNMKWLVGMMAMDAYWINGFGYLPWGHQHAHTYHFAFKEVSAVGSDYLAFIDGTSQSMITFDKVCVREINQA